MSSVVLITGGSRGIGEATAYLAAEQGYAVAISYRQDQEAAERVLNGLQQRGAQALALQADVAEEADVLRLFEQTSRQLGPITALVNNAGVLEQQMRLDEMSAERLQRVFSVNISGAFLCAREAVKCMSTCYGGQGGAIVNVSSAAARIGSPNEYIDYAASKGAIDTLTLGLAKEVATEGIRVNAVRPGLIETEIHARGGEPGRVARLQGAIPMQRGGSAEEVAEAIVWLMSEKASYVTGTLLDVTGGR